MATVVVTLVACIVGTAAIVVFIAIANWPRGATPRRLLGDTKDLAPFERL